MWCWDLDDSGGMAERFYGWICICKKLIVGEKKESVEMRLVGSSEVESADAIEGIKEGRARMDRMVEI